ncbi:MAG: hypothetical protein DHS80DRAFT_24882 [Piptocephalis tieghemiana]|nr:MAG: hypothetical protein DHS80DRAFT_24882 [Piptocephalis tieghemiana]
MTPLTPFLASLLPFFLTLSPIVHARSRVPLSPFDIPHCGAGLGGANVCAPGLCCSKWGFCGSTPEYCDDESQGVSDGSEYTGYPQTSRHSHVHTHAHQSKHKSTVVSTPSKPIIITRCTRRGQVALSFDDGPHIYTNDLLNTLKHHNNTKATFFVNYDNYNDLSIWEKDAILRRADREHHQIASHAYTHDDLDAMDEHEIRAQMNLNDKAIKRAIKKSPRYMRPPFGNAYKPLTRRVLGDMGYRIINWTFDTMDSRDGTTTDTSVSAYHQNLEAFSPSLPGPIILHHDPQEHTAHRLLDRVIPLIRHENPSVQFVTVAECLGDPHPYF